MRVGRRSFATWIVMAAVVGCGGKVVVDVGQGSAGGNGGSASTTSTGTVTGETTGTSGGPSCGPTTCNTSESGVCQCDGVCTEAGNQPQSLEVLCQPIQGGANCTCIENGIKIAVCTQPGTASCSFTTECCAAQFFGQTSTGGG